MSTVITNVFTLMSEAFAVFTANPLLIILCGLVVASAIFSIVLSVFRRGRKRTR